MANEELVKARRRNRGKARKSAGEFDYQRMPLGSPNVMQKASAENTTRDREIWDEKGDLIKTGAAEIRARDQDHVPEVKVLTTLGMFAVPCTAETTIGEIRQKVQEWKPEYSLEQIELICKDKDSWGPLFNKTSRPRDDDETVESLWSDWDIPRRMMQLALWIKEKNEETGEWESTFWKMLEESKCDDWSFQGHASNNKIPQEFQTIQNDDHLQVFASDPNELKARLQEQCASLMKQHVSAESHIDDLEGERNSLLLAYLEGQFEGVLDALKARLQEQFSREADLVSKRAAMEEELENQKRERCFRADAFEREREALEQKLGALEDRFAHLAKENFGAQRRADDLEDRMGRLGEIAKGSVAQWYWAGEQEDQWHAYSMDANPDVEKAYLANNSKGFVEMKSGAYTYEINFESMKQINKQTRKERSIYRRVFDAQNTDPVKIIQLVLSARSQEAEAAQSKLEVLQKRHEADASSLTLMNQQLEDHQSQLTSHQRANRLLALQYEKAMAEKTQCEANLAALKADMQSKESSVTQTLLDLQRENHALKVSLAQEREAKKELESKDAAHKEVLTLEVDKSVSFSSRSMAEFWKARGSDLCEVEEAQFIKDSVAKLFKSLSHQHHSFNGQPSRCHKFQSMRVKAVKSLHNPQLWKKYVDNKQILKEHHRKLGIHVAVLSIPDFKPLLPGVWLDESVNEVLLAHGCDEMAAHSIMKDGFDIRFTNTNGGSLYGEGMYFTFEPCKCNQYAHPGPSQLRHIVLSRVVMGDPCFLKSEHTGRVPPRRDEANPAQGRYDSIVVDPSISQRGQAHWEFVVFDGAQAYPEMLITYEIP